MTRIVSVDSVVERTAISLLDNEDLYVLPTATLVSSRGNGVVAAFDLHDIQVAGAVYGAANGIVLGTLATKLSDLNSGIWIGADGAVNGGVTGITTQGSGIAVTNEGTVYGGSIGLSHLGNDSRVINLGTLAGQVDAIFIRGTVNLVENHGVMFSQGYGIYAAADTALPVAASASITVENYGTLSGQVAAFQAIEMSGTNVYATTLLNHGVISGKVNFADGNDLYDGHDGTATRVAGFLGDDTMLGGDARDTFLGEGGNDLLDGGAGNDLLVGGTEADTLEGGDGNDVLRPGAGFDFIDGGAGTRDILDYAGSATVAVSLKTGDAQNGDAGGDIFTGIEGVAGGLGGDQLVGDSGANVLFGREGNDNLIGDAGNDVLNGDGGNDTLTGAAGLDVLRGGAGADSFIFVSSTESGAPGQPRDRIADFSSAEVDRINLSFIDADLTLAGNQAFTFIGTAAFSAAGQARFVQIGGNTIVFANTDAAFGTGEFGVTLSGTVALTAADFVL